MEVVENFMEILTTGKENNYDIRASDTNVVETKQFDLLKAS